MVAALYRETERAGKRGERREREEVLSFSGLGSARKNRSPSSLWHSLIRALLVFLQNEEIERKALIDDFGIFPIWVLPLV